ncbi:uncharacterized protein AB675_11684 [Cyphellophora attinorum]|uniref:F-box domain-containing protein n=1 Tax=Cyphellophora attinorum TaxID=1664694 RepID=A0A0N1HHQ1_9EURO|nr:uncharacterized protein AB675_11684 [Phialophora attinorum]KPI35385.1 hypothetical protein AB675_11684 [Phialophora attinorum]
MSHVSTPPWVKPEPKLDCMPPEIIEKILGFAIPPELTITATYQRTVRRCKGAGLCTRDWRQSRPFVWDAIDYADRRMRWRWSASSSRRMFVRLRRE